MPNIKPVSDLRNYSEVLGDVTVGEPVFLTKNGRGRYALVDMAEFERLQAALKLIAKLAASANAVKSGAPYITVSQLEKELEV